MFTELLGSRNVNEVKILNKIIDMTRSDVTHIRFYDSVTPILLSKEQRSYLIRLLDLVIYALEKNINSVDIGTISFDLTFTKKMINSILLSDIYLDTDKTVANNWKKLYTYLEEHLV